MTRSAAGLIVALVLGIPGVSLAAEGERPAKAFRVGILTPNPLAVISHRLEAFRQGMRDLGYVEGRDLTIEVRTAEGHRERLPALAAELVGLRVDAIVAGSTLAIRAAKEATGTTPIVMAYAADPVASGFVASLARPGGNITGLRIPVPEVSGKRLELLTQVVPRASRVAVLINRTIPVYRSYFDEMQGAAMVLGLKLLLWEVPGAHAFEDTFARLARERPDALFVLEAPLTRQEEQRLVDLAAKARLPAMYHNREFVDAGGLMSYGPNRSDMFRQATTYVDKILKGASPADLPVGQPTRFEMVVNLKTAKALGLTIPQSILARAEQVIQ